ncbi:ZIP family metal transporter [Mucilaginibacter sp.]|uniref:ZIP family metal transporter n=1 Tax=Mucilaginibacter sp. TaxID=1882438 RepID=UPI003AFF6505
MNYWIVFPLFFSAFFGGTSIFLFKKDMGKNLKLILSFSGAYLFAITVLHLIPDAYQSGDRYVGIFIMAGFLFQLILELFSDGVEHGHIHHNQHNHEAAFPSGIMISLCLHAFLEGMPLAQGHQQELVFGIALHHVPAAFALGSVLMQNHLPKKSILFLLVVFSLMTPAGFYTSHLLSTNLAGLKQYFSRIMGIVIGIFLHISTTILFESSSDHKFNLRKMVAVLIGSGIALITFFAES